RRDGFRGGHGRVGVRISRAAGASASAAPAALAVDPDRLTRPVSTLGGMDTISFARGIPAPECLPVEELADCARAAVERDGRTILSYGPAGGYAPLREWIAERHGVEPGRVLITNGSAQGFV